jgi:hypothetical protein
MLRDLNPVLLQQWQVDRCTSTHGSYVTELYYGNAEVEGANKKRVWSQGRLSHTITLLILLASMILLVIGAAFASIAF